MPRSTEMLVKIKLERPPLELMGMLAYGVAVDAWLNYSIRLVNDGKGKPRIHDVYGSVTFEIS